MSGNRFFFSKTCAKIKYSNLDNRSILNEFSWFSLNLSMFGQLFVALNFYTFMIVFKNVKNVIL